MEEQRLIRELMAKTGDAIIFADCDGRIRFWNRGAEDVFGYREEEVLGESLDIIIPEQFRERHWDGYNSAMERGGTTYDRGERLSVPAVRKDGERISSEFTVTMIYDANEELAGIAAILRDVTDQWEAQQERKERIRDLKDRIEHLEAHKTDSGHLSDR